MDGNIIKNFNELAATSNRRLALEIIEAGALAINTTKVVKDSLVLKDNILHLKDEEFDLSKFKNIKVVGFGKSSVEAALALEDILGSKITTGAVIGLEKADTKYIQTFSGTHPHPSEANVPAGHRIYDIVTNSTEEDLIIALVSGGGSALLCYPESEYMEGAKLYESFLKAGKTISDMNTVRKHLSLLKGGGLAKAAFPATIVGLIFSDVPGNAFENVASGPTYKDNTTIEDAQKIITDNELGSFNLVETPKEDKYFTKVHNFVLVSNTTAIETMANKAREFGLESKILSTDLYDKTDTAIEKIFSAAKKNSVVLAAGETSVSVPKNPGRGGRNLHMGIEVIRTGKIKDDSVFVAYASDGMDNSDAAGAIVDKSSNEKMEKLGLNPTDYAERFDSYNFFQKTGDMIITGPTGANVSDIMLLLCK